ncbi:MAG TPA: SDR family NAD(P)-dependent oxidoreductase [Acetobacteraceae bacterium]|nr:SDR family NAD(P)-dependent oxidoreductase [Acetobacteraceae bacterium]
MSMQEFRGKTAIVTGAASGIGFGIALALAEAGMNLVLADIQPDKIEPARAAIEALGVPAIGVTVDVSDAASVAAAGRAAVEKFGKLHVAVNNAGVAMHGTKLTDVGLDEWRWVVGVNVMGAIHGIRSFVPLIRRHGEGGHVVNTASISGFFVREGANQGAYSMTKYAVLALSEALEQELAGSGIGVSVLCPGAVNTNIFGSAATRPAQFGGPYVREAQEKLRDRTLSAGLPPEAVGRRVVRAMRDGEFYIVTHAAERAAIQARHRRIEAALDQAAAQPSPDGRV